MNGDRSCSTSQAASVQQAVSIDSNHNSKVQDNVGGDGNTTASCNVGSQCQLGL